MQHCIPVYTLILDDWIALSNSWSVVCFWQAPMCLIKYLLVKYCNQDFSDQYVIALFSNCILVNCITKCLICLLKQFRTA